MGKPNRLGRLDSWNKLPSIVLDDCVGWGWSLEQLNSACAVTNSKPMADFIAASSAWSYAREIGFVKVNRC